MVDRVNVSMNSKNETPEAEEARAAHEEEMIKVAEAGTSNIKDKNRQTGVDTDVSPDAGAEEESTESTTQRPDNIPEKFWDAEKGEVNVEALLKSQQDAEAALRNKTDKPEETPEGDTEGEGESTEAQSNAVAKASEEYAEKGELSADTYAALDAQGLPKEMVDQYIEGQKAIVGQLQSAAWGQFGDSQENYDAAVEWAVENLTEDEINALDVQITSTNPAIVQQGAKALAAKYAANADIEPDTTVSGGGNSPESGAYFKSGSEMQEAMSDPRYKKDANFRAEVMDKIDRAEKRGVNLFS